MNTWESPGIRSAIDNCGDTGPIILSHCFAAKRRSNRRLTDRHKLLSRAGFPAVAPDACKHGGSNKPKDPNHDAPNGSAASRDTGADSPMPLAESIPGAKAAKVRGHSHLSRVTDRLFKVEVLGLPGCR